MTVWLALRSPEITPTERWLKRFDQDATVLAWFQRQWRECPRTGLDAVFAWTNELLGIELSEPLAWFFIHEVRDKDLPVPASMAALTEVLSGSFNVRWEEHGVQLLGFTEGKSGLDSRWLAFELAYYLFDDAFLAEHRELATLLLHTDWRLPDETAEADVPRKTAEWLPETSSPQPDVTYPFGPGRVFCADVQTYNDNTGGNLRRLSADDLHQLRGVRIDTLCRALLSRPEEKLAFSWHLRQLRDRLRRRKLVETPQERAFLTAVRENSGDPLTWKVWDDWLAERGERPAGLRLLERALLCLRKKQDYPEVKEPLIHVGRHLVQYYFFYEAGMQLCDYWFAFDDLWAARHPDFARCLARYATRWDVLTTSATRSSG
jgi:hypothetical protein